MKKDERTLEEVWVDLQLSMPPLAPRSHAQYYHYTTAAAKERIKQGGRLNFRLRPYNGVN